MNTSKNIINKLTLLVIQECYEEIFHLINSDEDTRNSLLEIEKLVNVNYAHTTKTFNQEFFLALNETEIDTLIKIFTLLDGWVHEFTFDSQTPVPILFNRLQDLKETTASLILQFEDFLDEANSLLNIYLSSTSQKTNEVMKLLTIYSVFFMPLTFIVGVYGMNFEYMPELHWKYGYHFCMAIMTLISIVIFIWFKRKKVL